MNKQEVFDKVLTHLRKQGKAAVNGMGNCRYRTDDGLMCAVGCLIKDEFYSPELEGSLFKKSILKALYASEIDEEIVKELKNTDSFYFQESFLKRLQRAHDGYLTNCGIKGWENEMKEIAQDFDLNYTESSH